MIPLGDCRTKEFYTVVPRSQDFLLSVQLSFDELRLKAFQSSLSCHSHISGKVVLDIVEASGVCNKISRTFASKRCVCRNEALILETPGVLPDAFG